MTLDVRAVETLIELALQEDLGAGDWTTDSLIPPDHQTRCAIFAQAEGILCGVEVAKRVFQRLDFGVRFPDALQDGARLAPDTPVLTLEGNTRALLKAERTALNFLQRLSGIATRTRLFVDAVAGTGAQIVDTRKTTPALRLLEKYAVRIGGGRNHRVGLYDGVLI
jgi:nicotinate-nucleotide pyrophosphorylase (carboxylating)